MAGRDAQKLRDALKRRSKPAAGAERRGETSPPTWLYMLEGHSERPSGWTREASRVRRRDALAWPPRCREETLPLRGRCRRGGIRSAADGPRYSPRVVSGKGQVKPPQKAGRTLHK